MRERGGGGASRGGGVGKCIYVRVGSGPAGVERGESFLNSAIPPSATPPPVAGSSHAIVCFY